MNSSDPHLTGRETDTTGIVTCHEGQRMAWAQALALQSPHPYCCAVYRSCRLLPFSTVHCGSLLPQAQSVFPVISPRSATLVLTSSQPATLVLPFQAWLGFPLVPRPEPDLALLATCSSHPLRGLEIGPVFSFVQQVDGKRKHGTLASFLILKF